jgi:protein phosphatase
VAETQPQRAATRLVHEAMLHGGRDNITALVVDATAVRTRANRPGDHTSPSAAAAADEVDGDTLPRVVATGGF